MFSVRTAPALVLAASIATLGAAFAFQYLGGLDPCVLCLYQRYPYGVTGALGLAGVAHAAAGRPRAVPWLLGLCAVTFLAGAGIAGFHVGVEQHWWVGTASCTGAGGEARTLEELREQILAAPVVRCDKVAWSLFGVSMAGYNFLASLALAGFSLLAVRRMVGSRAA